MNYEVAYNRKVRRFSSDLRRIPLGSGFVQTVTVIRTGFHDFTTARLSEAGAHHVIRRNRMNVVSTVSMNAVRFLKILVLASLTAVAPLSVGAAPVTFWFKGFVDSFRNTGNVAPTGVGEGTPVVGRISYDPAGLWYAETNSSNGSVYSQYHYDSLAAFSFTIYLAGHTISNITNWGVAGQIGVENDVSGRDFYYVESGALLTLDGTNMVAYPNQVGMTLGLTDAESTALTSTALPTTAPVLSQFAGEPFFNIVARNAPGTVDLCYIGGMITEISTNQIVPLSIHRVNASTARVTWPLYAEGYTLQTASSLNLTKWQDVSTPAVKLGGEYAVTVSTTGSPKYYRLRK